MRHNKSFNHLGRKSGHRKSMLANMASSLILHKKIETTVAKAKALRVYIEPLITKSKEDSTHSRRTVFAYLKQKEAVTELFRVIAPKIADRPGGYTRILKIGFRQGDAADMALIEFVDFNEVAIAAAKPETKKATTRRSRVKKSDANDVEAEEKPKAPKAKAEPKAKAAPKAKAPKVEEKAEEKAE
jgi:large subunit ribosomal protein L17